MEQKHPVVSLIEKLYKSRDVIASLYDADDILTIESIDKYTLNQLNSLVNAQFVVSSGADAYSLDTDLTRLFDKGLRHDTISYLHADIGGEISKIKHSFSTYTNIKPGTHVEVIRRNKRELTKLFLGLSHRFNSTAEELFRRTQINFGRTDYTQSRALENKYYLQELEKLKNSYLQVISFLDADEFKQEPLIEDLTTTFKGRTMQFFDKIGQTISLVQQFAYRERKQEQRTTLLRRLMQHLKDNPALRFDDTIESGGNEGIYALPEPIQIRSAPDINNPVFIDGYLDVLAQLKLTLKPTEAFQRDRSTCDITNLDQKEQQISLADTLLKKMFVYMVKSDYALTGVQLLEILDKEKQLDPKFWNYTLLNAFFTKRKINNIKIHQYLRHKPLYEVYDGNSGNRTVKDVVIASKTLPTEVLDNV